MSCATNKPKLPMMASALLLVLLGSGAVWAVDYPLSEEAVREAYFLGRSDDFQKLRNFTDQYNRPDGKAGRASQCAHPF